MNFRPSPGIAILIEEKEDDTSINLSDKKSGRIRKGKIIAMGQDDITQNGTPIKAEWFGKVGDIVYFMHYYDEGGVDYTDIGFERHYFVKFQDFRSKIE